MTAFEERKCLVRDCPNHADGGTMVGDLCAPCYEMLTTGSGSPASRQRIISSVKGYDAVEKIAFAVLRAHLSEKERDSVVQELKDVRGDRSFRDAVELFEIGLRR